MSPRSRRLEIRRYRARNPEEGRGTTLLVEHDLPRRDYYLRPDNAAGRTFYRYKHGPPVPCEPVLFNFMTGLDWYWLTGLPFDLMKCQPPP
jgi:hypothetical protein